MVGLVTLTITDELWEGLGVVIIFGIAFATLLTLIVVPVMYSLFEAIHYQMVSALRGPRWKDPRRGRRFHFSHRRWARTKLAVIVAVQAVTVFVLFVKTDLATWIISTCQSKVIQAPTIFKTVVESIVFFLNLLVQYVEVLRWLYPFQHYSDCCISCISEAMRDTILKFPLRVSP